MNRPGTSLVRFLFIMLLLSAVLNGAAFWLKRVGWYEPQLHQYYMNNFSVGLGHQWTDEERKQLSDFTHNIYQSVGNERLLKLCKALWIGAFLIISLLLLWRLPDLPVRKPPWPLALMITVTAIGSVVSLIQFGPAMLLGGMRFFSFLIIATVGYWAVQQKSLHFLAQCLLLFLLFQVLLVPTEIHHGVHLFGTYFGARAAGTMLQPSSLGLMAVIGFIFYLQFSSYRMLAVPAFIATAILVVYSQSAAALLLLLIILSAKAYFLLAVRYRVGLLLWGGTAFILFIIMLPGIVQRPDVYDSLWGRLFTFEGYLSGLPDVQTLLFGQGLGAGTNAALNIMMNWQGGFQEVKISSKLFTADSTPLALLAQVGIVGVIAFYLLLAYAAWRDAKAAPLYLAISIASLTTIVTELFPVNVILGLLLARSLYLMPSEDGDKVSGRLLPTAGE
ncbi:hypothetical protein [Mariprofundus ferrooxydans]|uniref:hypothetical protein n=1 Tax=Mariprofundus ferrooxydans TaxID=314344 RepID=UPI0002F0C90B|nr:hypothetical protein [Mariprofundus ferrooxydans]